MKNSEEGWIVNKREKFYWKVMNRFNSTVKKCSGLWHISGLQKNILCLSQLCLWTKFTKKKEYYIDEKRNENIRNIFNPFARESMVFKSSSFLFKNLLFFNFLSALISL